MDKAWLWIILSLCIMPLAMANNMSGHAGYLWYDTLNVDTYTDYTYTAIWFANADGSSPNADDATLYIHNKFKTNDDDLKVEFVWKATIVDMTYSICNSPTLSTCLLVKLDDTNNEVETNNQGAGWDTAAMTFASGTQYNIKLLYNSSLNTFKVYVDNNLKLTSDAVAFNLSNFAYFGFQGVDNAAFIENYFISDSIAIPRDKGDIFLSIYNEKTPSTLVTSSLTVDLIGNYSETSTTSSGLDYFYVLEPGWYELRFGNDNNYPKRTYFINVSLGANSVNVYLLNSSYTSTTLLVKDQNSAPLPNAYITLQRNYVVGGQSVFYGLAILKTNNEGKAQVYLEQYDAYYKFQFSNQDGTNVYLLTDAIPVVSTTPTFFVNTEADVYESFSRYDDIVYNLSFMNTTGTPYARLIFADSTNILREACLKVDYVSASEYENVCYTCITAASGTLTCVVNNTWDGQFKAAAEFDTNTEHSWITAATEWWGKDPTFSFALPGLFIALIVVGTLALMGIGSVSGSILLMFLGIAAMTSLTLILGLSMKLMMTLGIFGLIVIFMIRRGTQ